MRLFRDLIRCDESNTSNAGPCSKSVTGRVKSMAWVVRTLAKIKSKEVDNLQYDNAFVYVSWLLELGA